MTDYSWHIPDPETQPDFYADVATKRAIAWGIDTAIVLILCLIAVLLTAFTGLLIFPLLFLVLGFAYRTVTLARQSATWGMRVMAIEFRTLSGARMDSSTAFLHTAAFTVAWAFFPVQIISVAMMLTSARGQGLGDLWLGTVALNRRAAT